MSENLPRITVNGQPIPAEAITFELARLVQFYSQQSRGAVPQGTAPPCGAGGRPGHRRETFVRRENRSTSRCPRPTSTGARRDDRACERREAFEALLSQAEAHRPELPRADPPRPQGRSPDRTHRRDVPDPTEANPPPFRGQPGFLHPPDVFWPSTSSSSRRRSASRANETARGAWRRPAAGAKGSNSPTRPRS